MTTTVPGDSTIRTPDGSAAAAGETVGLPPLVPDPGAAGEPFPLTPTQQALWVGRADAVELGNVGCYGYFEWERDELDLSRYRRAWERLVEHHPGLRTVVRPDGSQVVLEQPGPVPITVDDLRDDPEAARRLEESRAEGGHRRLDPGTWPMFDLRVVRLSDRVRVQLGIDLQLMDASSLFLTLFPDLIALYEDPDAELAPQRLAFRDFALWLDEEVRGGARWQADWRYWQERIDELPPAPDLPAARYTAEGPGQFERCTVRYPAEEYAVLRKRARDHHLTETELLVGVFAEVIRGWSSEPAFTLNVPVFQRFDVPGIEDVIGDYTNAILLEVRPTGQTVAERIVGLAAQLRDDIRHASVNGVDVLRELARRRGLTAASMPVVVTSLLGLPLARSISEFGAEVHSITQTPQVSLDFQIREEDGELRLVWDYRSGAFAPGLVEDAFEAFRNLIGRMLADEPGHGVWNAPHLDLRNRRDRAVWNEVNDTAEPVPAVLLQERFFAQARRTPDAEAVVAPDRRLTYAELADQAYRIGNGLREQDVRPGDLVGVVMEKGWEQYAAVYGILAAGGAYLPLDAAAPRARIARLLESAEVSIVLTQSRLADSLDLPAGMTVLRADTDFETASTEPLTAVQGPDDPAYVIYTSGSTGDPKGVVVGHRGVANLVRDVQRRFAVTSADRLLAISGLHFDASIYDVFGPLGCGAAVVLPPPFQRAEPDVWVDLVRDERVTIWNSVPVLMELLVGEAETRSDRVLGTLRLAVLSGDWIPLNLPDRARAQASGLQVVGSGGPTETICWSLFYPIGAVDPEWTSIPYGKPIANQRYYIVDRDLRPRPTWVRGEMAVASPVGLAIGYLGDPERTEAKFVTLPTTGERAYLTGDFGRLLPGGDIEILGREDFQVKVAGQRIELGEIEAVLNRVDGVRTAVVTAPRSSADVVRLQAFVVPETSANLSADALRAYLSEELPAVMVPAAIRLLPELPLTANGKVDRLALATLAAAPEPEQPAEPEPPADAGLLAELVAACVGEILGLDDVPTTGNFFRLGGDSLSGTRLAARLQELLGAPVPVRTVFGNPVISDLASLIAADPDAGPQALRVAHLLHTLEEPDEEPAAVAERPPSALAEDDPDLADLLAREDIRQQDTLVLVASSSVAPPSVLACAGSSLANLTTEGYPGRRYHAGAEIADEVERLAISRACALFQARAANVQPHSGSSANLAVLMGLLEPGDTILGLDLDCGGHLSHGSAASVTGRYFHSVCYRTGDDERLDYEQIAALAGEHRPKVVIAGASAYPREIDFARFREIADTVGAYLIADISHISGLVATGLHPSPIDHAHLTTTSTYKQLYGPRGGLILLGRDADAPGPDGRVPLRKLVDGAVFPLVQGTPDLGNVAAKARALHAAAQPAFRTVMELVLDNATAIADQLKRRGLRVVTDGTDTHMVLADLRPHGVTGADVEEALEACGILVNRNRVPGDDTPPRVTGGIRLGTNTLAARAVPPETAALCADLIADVVEELRTAGAVHPAVAAKIRAEVRRICAEHPIPGYPDDRDR
ncbi:amino acid adenylation domain-containing protein [Streptomyces puniciscabiei]|uniref:Probable serine hydroxymethyltransferase n=1 Tax=Streptomyces puniciscabiei TaxID=164348 RepID=A0A542UCI8_9ACTN|nr:non-ribosomal peptide synthetase [Streptomyces puniciscabiei]TQK96797.1 amino acid adenylation domain-containing protein [Streptomyces puniciscabiei]